MEKFQPVEAEQEQQDHHPRHRRDDVPVDGGEPSLDEFGENPDTELAG